MKIFLFPIIILFAFIIQSNAQDDDMMKLMHDDSLKKEYVSGAFKSSRIIMSHSMEIFQPGVLDFRILHRFGKINGGIQEFFGLDGPANVRLGLDYGLSDQVTIGLGRSTFKKEIDGFIKYRLIQQSAGNPSFPFSLLAVAGTTIRTAKWTNNVSHTFSDRLNYYGQVLLGRKFSNAFSMQLMPTFVRRNFVDSIGDAHNTFATGAGGRIKLSRRVSLNADYYYVFNPDKNKGLRHPLSIGIDIETGGHVFQLHFTNAHGMNERAFITETTNNWGKGDIEFGFNISRIFQVKKKKQETID